MNGQMINTNTVQQIIFTDTISLLIKKKSIDNYVIIKNGTSNLTEITVSLWINTTQHDTQVFFITYAAGDKPTSVENAFAIFTNKNQLTLTIANENGIANR